jgi:hypothetical protein
MREKNGTTGEIGNSVQRSDFHHKGTKGAKEGEEWNRV